MKGYIYVIENLENHKKYIGQTTNVEKRIYEHFRRLDKNEHVNQYLQNAYNKYGKDCFEYFYREFKDIDSEKLDILEKYYIEKYDSYRNGYNLTLGGKDGAIPNKLTLTDDEFAIIYHGGKKWKAFPSKKIAEHFSCSISFVNAIIRDEANAIQTEYARILTDDEVNKKIQEFEKIFDLKESDVFVDIKRKIFTDDEGVICLCLLKNLPDCHSVLAKKFNCETRVFTRMRDGETHKEIVERFNKLTEEEQRKIARQYWKEWSISGGKCCPLLKEDLFVAFAAKEKGKSSKEIADHFEISYSTMKSILNHSSRKKEYAEYLTLSDDEKTQYNYLIWP